MDGAKSPLQSFTIKAAAGSAVAGAVSLLGVHVDPALVTSGVDDAFQLVSIGLAAGRVRATATMGETT